MANGSNYALRAVKPALLAFSTLGADIASGALSTAKLVVTLAGCSTLVAGGLLISSEDARALLARQLPAQSSSASAVQMPAAESKSEDPATPPGVDDPRQKRVVQYLARRYRVADEAVRVLVSTAFQIGREKNLDPLLILSVVAIESGLNPFAESSMGAQGLMQVMTRIHAGRFEPHGGEIAALDPVANIKVGSSILHELISRGGSVERGLQLYVGAGNLPDDGGYGVRVLGERARLQLAASGKVDAAIAAGLRAAIAAPAVDAKSVALPVNANAETRAPFVPTPSDSASEAPQLPASAEHSV
ncbi:MAG: transglycosylase SLT domain-containing protein [Pseudomonadota bacterium]|nr:transglycosylase SLT domain-containing protein [Pseudomonadota bacterium]